MDTPALYPDLATDRASCDTIIEAKRCVCQSVRVCGRLTSDCVAATPDCIKGLVLNPPDHLVYVVDDDFRVREGIEDLLTSEGLSVVTFADAASYLGFSRPELPGCLVLDIELPDISGLELQSQLVLEAHPRIVFITGRGDVPSSVQAFKAGAVDFLTKPFQAVALLTAVHEAIALDRELRRKRALVQDLRQRLAELTPREQEVLPLVVGGLLNKQAAALLGISEITLQIHRGRIMRKLAADSLPDLVRMADALAIPLVHSRRSQK